MPDFDFSKLVDRAKAMRGKRGNAKLLAGEVVALAEAGGIDDEGSQHAAKLPETKPVYVPCERFVALVDKAAGKIKPAEGKPLEKPAKQ